MKVGYLDRDLGTNINCFFLPVPLLSILLKHVLQSLVKHVPFPQVLLKHVPVSKTVPPISDIAHLSIHLGFPHLDKALLLTVPPDQKCCF